MLPLAETSALCEEFAPNFRNGYVQLVSDRWEDAGLWLRQPGRADVEYLEVGNEETRPTLARGTGGTPTCFPYDRAKARREVVFD